MIARRELETKLNKYFDSIHFDKSQQKKIKQVLSTKHNLLDGQVNGVLKGMDDLSMLPDQELYWFAETCAKEAGIKLDKYFSESEQKQYSAARMNFKNKIYPLEFSNFQQVCNDQWVGTITVDQLYDMYVNAVINYNINTQRNPKVVRAGDKEYYKISVNNNSVKQIIDLYRRGLFIPNDLTFNIPLDASDNLEHEILENGFENLILQKGTVDIIDGFHRYKAAIIYKQKNPEWQYKFICNLVSFDEEKAKRYIAQQNKKNKIKASYARSLDDTRFETILVNKLNEDSESYYFGQIKALGSYKINSGIFISCLSIFNIKDMKTTITLEKRICRILNDLADRNPELLDGISDFQLRVFVSTIKEYQDRNDEEIVDKALENLDKLESDGVKDGSLVAVGKAIRKYKEASK